MARPHLLTEEELTKWARERPVRFVTIFAEWCGHCQRMEQKLQQMFAGQPMGPDGFPETDLTLFIEQKDAKHLETPRGFPTVRKYVNGVSQPSNQNELYEFLEANVLHHQPQRQQRRPQEHGRYAGGSGGNQGRYASGSGGYQEPYARGSQAPAYGGPIAFPSRPSAARSRSPALRVRRDLRPHEIVLPSRGARAPNRNCGFR